MVDFAGWDMPVQYAGVREEHMAVRTKAGIFDVSHMGEIEIIGPKALEIVQKITCNDASRLKPGQSQYSAFLTERGTFVDDIIVNRLAPDRFLICVNASNTDKDFAWISPHATRDTKILNRSDDYFLIAVQGPAAEGLVGTLLGAPRTGTQQAESLPNRPFTFIETALAGVPVLISRTGYTGEDGFEIYGPWNEAEKIWAPLVEAGATPCGLGARDTLRLEAALPLYGHEIDDTILPFEAGLGWIVKMEKGDFVGRDALRATSPLTPLLNKERVTAERQSGEVKLVGLEMREPGIARQGCKIFDGDREIGWVSSGTKSPFLDRAIAMGYVAAEFAPIGTKIDVDIHSKNRHAEIVSLPFYRRKKRD